MGTAAKPTRENRTITVDFRSEATYFQLLGDRKASPCRPANQMRCLLAVTRRLRPGMGPLLECLQLVLQKALLCACHRRPTWSAEDSLVRLSLCEPHHIPGVRTITAS